MKKNIAFISILIFYGFAVILAVPAWTQNKITGRQDVNDPALIERGAYLARLGDCTTCHTREEKGAPEFSGGRALHTVFGKIYSSNITPDPQYGIGDYTLHDFEKAVREGINKDGRHLYPAMPYPSFSKMSDGDIRALYAFFMHGVRPVAEKPRETRLPFPFSQRWGIWFWNKVFKPTHRYKPDDARSAEWNRGAYIVTGIGHCGACHTPRGPAYNELGYNETSPSYLTGQTLEHWYAPNLRGDLATGLGRWGKQDIVDFLKTGRGHGSAAFGIMKDAVEKSTQYYTDEDLNAVAAYLKSLPPSGERATYKPGGAAEKPDAYPREYPGAGIYAQACARCHKPDGMGDDGAPRLAGSAMVLARDPSSIIRIVLQGGETAQTTSTPETRMMPAFYHKLDDRQIANVLSYVRQSWGNSAAPVREGQVASMRAVVKELSMDEVNDRSGERKKGAAGDENDAKNAHHGRGNPKD